MREPSVPQMGKDRPSGRLTTRRAKLETVVIDAAFVLFVLFALKLLLLSRPPDSERSLNLIPFASISHYLFSGSSSVSRFAFGNLAGNVILFIPLGAYLSVRIKATLAGSMLTVASASVAVEILQGVFAIGVSDIDDVILNYLGGLIGIQLIVLLEMLLRTRDRVRAVLAVLSLVSLPVTFYLLFVIRLHM